MSGVLTHKIVRLEQPDDYPAIREVNRLAFGREDEGRLIDALRTGGYARLSLVAEEEGRVVGHFGHRVVIVLGHPDYYPRFGFSAKLAERLATPYAGAAFMALELVPGALKGVSGEVNYPPPFADGSWR